MIGHPPHTVRYRLHQAEAVLGRPVTSGAASSSWRRCAQQSSRSAASRSRWWFDSRVLTYRSFVADSRRWQGFEHRDGDIVISTPPKAGTTWTQMLVALLVFDSPDFYDRLGMISPWLESDFTPIDVIRARLGAQEHRRFIKTHAPLDGLPLDERVSYVVVGRDPRDIWLSREQHGENVDLDRIGPILAANLGEEELARRAAIPRIESFAEAVAAPEGGNQIAADPAHVLHHLRTGWDRRDQDNVQLLHYADLQADVVREMTALARALGFPQSDARIRDWPATARSAGCAIARISSLLRSSPAAGGRPPTSSGPGGCVRGQTPSRRPPGVRRPGVRSPPRRGVPRLGPRRPHRRPIRRV